MNVVIVESPAKAKTINKYLGKDFTVLASFGHVRDLPAKDGSVKPDQDFAMDWEVDKDSNKRLTEIAKALKGAQKLYLATDPDREGEAISWHVLEVLKKKKALNGIDIKRVVFSEITKSAILKAMAEPRVLDQELVDAYLARRALDYLVGFTLSPVLWRKLPGARSAGRVQSVALRLICEREQAIETFKPVEYWSVEADATTQGKGSLNARLVGLNGKKLKKYDLSNEVKASNAVSIIKSSDLTITDVEKKPARRSPAPPFTTSTLQQEAARKLYFSAQRTMQVAQKLYEGKTIDGETTGLITYMRTDGLTVASEAMTAARGFVQGAYGKNYIPAKPNVYRSKAKNAQEAHEAIRPTDPTRKPSDVAHALNADELKLYDLIWRRLIASQMAQAMTERTTITLENADKSAELRATGTVITFDGFLKMYQEGHDDGDGKSDDNENLLPKVNKGEKVALNSVTPKQHFTEPPARFSEASLVKKMEELGIGRPSTYASTLSVLRDRDYVRMESQKFYPEAKGRLVIAFLENFFHRYVEYDFTANLENDLDEISAGKEDWKKVLHHFWSEFKPKTEEVIAIRNSEIIDAMDDYLSPLLFPETEDGSNQRKCPKCEDGRLGLKAGRYGAFVGCSNYPECSHTKQFDEMSKTSGDGQKAVDDARDLGEDPETGQMVHMLVGRFGPYVQIGMPEKGSKDKPKRSSIPKDMDAATITLEQALKLLNLPRDVGEHPETGKMIKASIGRYGPYVMHDGAFASLKTTEDVFSIGINHAVSTLADAANKKSGGKTLLKDFGTHPDGDGEIKMFDGRYGPYVNYKKINATIPKNIEPTDVTLEQALELLAAKAKKKPAAKKGKKKAAKK